MSGGRHHEHDDGWQPATSAPGELFTFEGRLRADRAFWRGLLRANPRNRGYRRSMMRSAAIVLALAIPLFVLIALVAAIL